MPTGGKESGYMRNRGMIVLLAVVGVVTMLVSKELIAADNKPVRERVDKEKVQGSFLDLVEDVSKLDEYFAVQEVAQDKEGFVFLLLPKKEGMLKQARMWVDTKYLVRQIEITEITGNTNTLSFSSIKVNKPLDDALFIFNPGKKEIMER